MSNKLNLKNFSFLIYGLGATGTSVINYFKKKNISNYKVWDDNVILKKKFHSKIATNISKTLKNVDYIVLSPGISLKKTKYKKNLIKFREKIISDIDLLYLDNKDFKSIIVTGSNGKSTTCKIIEHLLKKNKFNVVIGGNIGTPVLNVKIKKKTFFVIEASSFQLSHSQFIHPNYAILLNITNDHVDWHGSMQEYIKSKFKIFQLQKKDDFALVNSKLKNFFKKRKYQGKLTPIKFKDYKNIKIKNEYLNSNANFENMNFVYTLAKLLKITDKSFIKSMNNFVGLSHRYEVFLKKKNVTFINDSKATSFQATKFALTSSKNIFWILGGIPKNKDQIEIKNIKKNIIKSYIIGKNRNFFIKQLKNKIKISTTKNLKTSIIQALQDIRIYKKLNNIILLSPSAASFDQYKNFEDRGRQFKKLCKYYARKYI